MNTPIVKTKNLTKNYNGKNCVDHLDLEIKSGRIYGFLGPNGAGKSTTMKMLVNLVNPSEGQVKIFGKELIDKERTSILEKVGSLIEGPSFYGHLSAKENMEILGTLFDIDQKQIDQSLKMVGLFNERNKKVNDYSLGMKQRLGIAMALLKNPRLLILDEPTNGLDPGGTQEMRKLLLHLAHEEGITIMISTHLLSEIEKIADDVGILNKGKLIYQGSLKELEKLNTQNTIFKTSNNEQALNLLANYKAELKEGMLIISNLDNIKRAQIIRKLVNNNIDVFECIIEENSLEDLFLRITDRF